MEARTLEQRIDSLERKNRTLTRVVALGGFTGVSLLVVSLRSPQAQSIETRELRVVDSAGKSRIELKVSDQGPTLQLLDDHGNSRVLLDVAENGPRVRIEDEKKLNRAELSFGVLGDGPGVFLTGENGGKHTNLISSRFDVTSGGDRVSLGIRARDGQKAGDARVDEFFMEAKDRHGSLSLDSGDGALTLSIRGKEGLCTTVGENGFGLWGPKMTPRLVLSSDDKVTGVFVFDKKGRNVANLTGGSGVVVKDSDGEPRVILGMCEGKPQLVMLDSENNMRVALTEGMSGGESLQFKDVQGTPRLSLGDVNGEAGLALSGADGTIRTGIGAGKIILNDGNGKARWTSP